MKLFFVMLLLCSSIFTNCYSSYGITNVEPKTGAVDVPANGEYRLWKDVKHGSFTVLLTNSSRSQSVELYKVKANGNEK